MKHIKKSFSFSMPGKEITLEDHRGNSRCCMWIRLRCVPYGVYNSCVVPVFLSFACSSLCKPVQSTNCYSSCREHWLWFRPVRTVYSVQTVSGCIAQVGRFPAYILWNRLCTTDKQFGHVTSAYTHAPSGSSVWRGVSRELKYNRRSLLVLSAITFVYTLGQLLSSVYKTQWLKSSHSPPASEIGHYGLVRQVGREWLHDEEVPVPSSFPYNMRRYTKQVRPVQTIRAAVPIPFSILQLQQYSAVQGSQTHRHISL